jgi:hypothetical protein
MAVDFSRVVRAAVEAALGQDTPTKNTGLSTGRALAAGAALVVVGRVAAGPGGRFVRDKIQERLSDDSESEDAQDEELDEEPEAEVEEDEEPEAEVEEDEQTEAEGEGDGPGRPRHPLFEQALAGKGAQRRSSPSPQGRKPKGRPRIAPPRRPSRPRTPARRA